ncbi:DNA polymerase III subunit gamma/tau [Methyloraptor flagellatus]|uniref:DNA polymerase III subunit gamma/tau n=1 Tax=Methyloraptor flagellatus TaxID=3162530 RepID=A0AAU7X738_9HYPH
MDGLFPKDGPEGAGAPEAKPGVYRVLARKYRPQSFDDLIGQEPMVRTLSNAFDTGRIAQGYMLTGVRGVGKTTTARILARALNYEIPGEIDRPTIHMDRLGSHCRAIMEGRHVDVIEMDAASHTGIGDIREIIEAVRYKPVSARTKVYIIDEVHMLSTAAFNGLLKTLEEPPEHVKFIFATTEIRKVPITILSRCQRFDLRRIEADVLLKHLGRIAEAEGVTIEEEALKLVARAAEGSVRDSLSLLDQAIAHGQGAITADQVRQMLGLADRARVIDLFEHVMKGDAAAALAELRAQYDVGADPAVVVADLAEFVHFVTRLKVVPEAASDSAATEAEVTRGGAFAAALSIRILGRAWQILLKGLDEVKTAAKPLAAAEMLLIRLCYAADLPTPDEAIRLLRDGAGAGGASGGAASGGGSGAAGQGGSGSYGAGPGGASGALRAAVGAASVAAGPIGEGARMALPRGGADPVAQAGPRLVASTMPAPATETRPAAQPAAQPARARFRSLADVAALAAEKRDIKLKIAIERQMRLVRLEPGRIEVQVTPDAAKDLTQDLGRKLQDWTGERWLIAVSREEGGATIFEERQAAREQLYSDARSDPLVAAVLRRFPGASIVDIRVNRDEAEIAAERAAEAGLPVEGMPPEEPDDPGWNPDD